MTTDINLRWRDPLTENLNATISLMRPRTWRADHFAASSELRTDFPATAVDRALTLSARATLTGLVRAGWALSAAPSPELIEATALLSKATPGPWGQTHHGKSQLITTEVGVIAEVATPDWDAHLLAEALPGEIGEDGHQMCVPDIDLLAAAPRLMRALATQVRTALVGHEIDLDALIGDCDLNDEDDRATAAEIVADIGVWSERSDLIDEARCRCGARWTCPVRQVATHHLTGGS